MRDERTIARQLARFIRGLGDDVRELVVEDLTSTEDGAGDRGGAEDQDDGLDAAEDARAAGKAAAAKHIRERERSRDALR